MSPDASHQWRECMQLRAFRNNPLIQPGAHSARRCSPRVPHAPAAPAQESCDRSFADARPYHRPAAGSSSWHWLPAGRAVWHRFPIVVFLWHRFPTGVCSWHRFPTGVCFCGSPTRNGIVAPAPHSGRTKNPTAQTSLTNPVSHVSSPPRPMSFDGRAASRPPRRRTFRSSVSPESGFFAGAHSRWPAFGVASVIRDKERPWQRRSQPRKPQRRP